NKNAGTAKAVNVTGVSLSGADAVNYSVAATGSTTADIPQRTLSVTAGNVTRQEGQPNPSLVFSLAGLLAGDTVPLDLATLLSTTAGLSAPAGSYPIRVREVTAGDYVIRGVDGILTVSPAARIDANSLLSTSLATGSQAVGQGSSSTLTKSAAPQAEPNRPLPPAVTLPTGPAGSRLARSQAGSDATTDPLRLTVSLTAPQQTISTVGLSVTLPDGVAVPQWVSVDTAAGTVTVDASQTTASALDLRVTVKDPAGADQVRRWLIPLLP
ncbi:MAG: MBG domain-containing protein, partial [Betaproteobacteria bacterium]